MGRITTSARPSRGAASASATPIASSDPLNALGATTMRNDPWRWGATPIPVASLPGQRPVEIVDEVARILDAEREPHHGIRYSAFAALLGRHHAVRCHGRH